jgi:glycosyltransferase involved in cell wall biosynthesis
MTNHHFDAKISTNEVLCTHLQWNSYCSHNKKIFYVATPKVACSSIKWWFAELEGISESLINSTDSNESDPELIIHDTLYKVAPHITGLPLENLEEALYSDDFFRFAIVRNPYKRIFSAWQSKILLREPFQSQRYKNQIFFHFPLESKSDITTAFESFLIYLHESESLQYKDVHWTPQFQLLRPDLISYSAIGKIEEVKDLEKSLLSHLGSAHPSPFSTRRANESLIPFSPEFISNTSASIIKNLYEKDFKAFGYSMTLPSSICSFSQEQMLTAIAAIKMLRGRHKRLHEVRDEFSKQHFKVSELLDERNAELSNMVQIVADQDEQIIRHNEQIIRHNEQIIRHNEQINGYIKTLEAIYTSKSWRLSAPIRFYEHWYSRLNLMRKAIPSTRQQVGGYPELFQYAFNIWRQDGVSGLKVAIRKRLSLVGSAEMPESLGKLVSDTPSSEDTVITSSISCPEILFISHEASRTGAPIFLINLAILLKEQLGVGCVFLLRNGGELESEFRKLGKTMILSNQYELDQGIIAVLKKRNIKLIYSNTATNGKIQQRLKFLSCPILCHVHELGHSLEQVFTPDNLKAVLSSSDHFFAGSGAVANYLNDQKGLPPEKVTVAYPFVDVKETLNAAKHSKPPLSLPSNAIIVGACGTISWRKGTDLFIQLVKKVGSKTSQPIHFVWVGGAPSQRDYQNLSYDVELMDLSHQITFTGSVTHHLSYFQQFDIFLLPSREDPFPLVVLDAASMKIPVVCFDRAGGAQELVEDDAGIVVPYMDIDAMATAVISLAKNSSLRRKLGETAQTKVLERHDIGIGGHRIVSFIQSNMKLLVKEN